MLHPHWFLHIITSTRCGWSFYYSREVVLAMEDGTPVNLTFEEGWYCLSLYFRIPLKIKGDGNLYESALYCKNVTGDVQERFN